jgi:hypothetical protein
MRWKEYLELMISSALKEEHRFFAKQNDGHLAIAYQFKSGQVKVADFACVSESDIDEARDYCNSTIAEELHDEFVNDDEEEFKYTYGDYGDIEMEDDGDE